MNRRTFLKKASGTAASLVFVSGKLYAAAKQQEYEQKIDDLEIYDFIMPRVKFPHIDRPGMSEGPDYWSVRPGGDRNLLNRLSDVIRCRIKPIPNVEYDGFDPQYAAEDQLNAVVTFDEPDKINKYPFKINFYPILSFFFNRIHNSSTISYNMNNLYIKQS